MPAKHSKKVEMGTRLAVQSDTVLPGQVQLHTRTLVRRTKKIHKLKKGQLASLILIKGQVI